MRPIKTIFLFSLFASALFAASAEAAKLNDVQFQDWLGQLDEGCKLNFQHAPAKGLEEPEDIDRVCTCIHAGNATWLKETEFDSPAAPDVIDLGKITVKSAQLSYQCLSFTAKAKSSTKQCLAGYASSKESDPALIKRQQSTCACVGQEFARQADDDTLRKLSTEAERLKQFKIWINQAYSRCTDN